MNVHCHKYFQLKGNINSVVLAVQIRFVICLGIDDYHLFGL